MAQATTMAGSAPHKPFYKSLYLQVITAIVIGISLTHEQMAGMTGTTRVTVTRVLKRLGEQGVIQIKGKQLRILDLGRLTL